MSLNGVYGWRDRRKKEKCGPAVWRGGDGHNVSLNDTRNVWHDFTANEGGGVLDLVVRICGGSRQDALRWLADFAGVPLDNQPLSATERADWARRQLKAALADAKLPRPEAGEIAFWTNKSAFGLEFG